VAKENKLPANTIRISCSVDIPYDNEILNYGNKSKKILLDYIKNGGYYVVKNGPNKRST
jgi:hypothetical protein